MNGRYVVSTANNADGHMDFFDKNAYISGK